MKLKPGTSSKSTDKRPFKTFRKRFTDTPALNGEHDRDWRPFFVARNEAVDTNHGDVDVKDVFLCQTLIFDAGLEVVTSAKQDKMAGPKRETTSLLRTATGASIVDSKYRRKCDAFVSTAIVSNQSF